MIYSEKVRFARGRLGMSRMEFAVFLGSSEGHIRNIEVAKEGKEIRFSRDRETKITKEASLPPGFFVDSDVNINADKIIRSNNELFYRLFPNAKNKINYNEAMEMLNLMIKIKSRA